jgi:hypothetical protein
MNSMATSLSVKARINQPLHDTRIGWVEIFPKLSGSLQAILRKMRRMIFPKRVFGKVGAHSISPFLAKSRMPC